MSIMKKKFYDDKGLFFVPLGGSEEFGANLNLYICDGDFLAIDCGLGFADERYPGIDLLLPDPKVLEENKDRLKGMIITHAHEDHIGAVAYLWERFECPLYATPFTAAVLRKKLEQQGLSGVPIHIVETGSGVKIGKFEVDFLPVSHSVPDGCSLAITTSYGVVVHSGDWNLDPCPVVGKNTDEKAFKSVGAKGVLAYIGDSTNAQVDGRAGSESEVEAGLAAEFESCKGRIAITIFSSNIGRLVSIARAAQDTGRSVVIIGRSLHKMIAAAHECGYLNDIPDFLDEAALQNLSPENTVLVVTGSQGETRAALARISRGDHREVRLNKRDTVIFSSRAIPGNERNINAVKNTLSAAGINVITPNDTANKIHISGHPCRDEIQEMLGWLRPLTVIPVHGERLQLDAHAALAKNCQVANTIVPSNGSVIRIAPGKTEVIDHIETGMLAVDQRRIIPSDHQSIIARRKLQYSGTVHVSFVLNSGLEVLGRIKIDTVGLTTYDDDDGFEVDLCAQINKALNDLEADVDYEEDQIAEIVRIILRRYVQEVLGIKPKVSVHCTIVDI